MLTLCRGPRLVLGLQVVLLLASHASVVAAQTPDCFDTPRECLEVGAEGAWHEGDQCYRCDFWPEDDSWRDSQIWFDTDYEDPCLETPLTCASQTSLFVTVT